MEIVITNSARTGFIKELKNNNIPFEYGENMFHILVKDSPKVRIALRMTAERYGNRSFIIKSL